MLEDLLKAYEKALGDRCINQHDSWYWRSRAMRGSTALTSVPAAAPRQSTWCSRPVRGRAA